MKCVATSGHSSLDIARLRQDVGSWPSYGVASALTRDKSEGWTFGLFFTSVFELRAAVGKIALRFEFTFATLI